VIPIGTTARQADGVARWLLACVVVEGMLLWCAPSYRAWAALAGTLLLVFVLWLLSRTTAGERAVPSNPFHVALLGPMLVLARHAALAAIEPAASGPFRTLDGTLSVSLLTHLLLLALGVMLCQSLLGRVTRHPAVVSVCGGAMMAGPLLAVALALLGLGGVGVWLAPLWIRRGGAVGDVLGPRGRAWARTTYAAVGLVIGGGMVVLAPVQAVVAAGLLAATLLVAAAVFRQHRRDVVAAAAGLGLAGAAALLWLRPDLPVLRHVAAGPWGAGDRAFTAVSARDSGLVVLGAVTGWVGLLWLLGGLVVALVWLLSHARRGRTANEPLAVVWTASSAVLLAAMLAPGGLPIPSVTLAASLALGLLPVMLGRRPVRRSGAWTLAPLAALLLILGLPRSAGLADWCAAALGLGDAALHAGMGAVACLVLLWLLGARRARWGLVGFVAAVAVGAVGEVVQHVATNRSGELRDFAAHALGCTAALAAYLLAIGARGWESADVRPPAVRGER